MRAHQLQQLASIAYLHLLIAITTVALKVVTVIRATAGVDAWCKTPKQSYTRVVVHFVWRFLFMENVRMLPYTFLPSERMGSFRQEHASVCCRSDRMAALQQKLEKLYTLLHTGVLSEDEFNRRKEAMIDEFVGGADKAAQSTSYSSLTVAQPVVAVAPTAVVQEEYSGPLICCRLRGLPFTVTSQEVINFLEGFSIDWASGGIKLVMDPANENICTGIGYVVFTSEAEAQRAVQVKFLCYSRSEYL